jgi:hypothetical protein
MMLALIGTMYPVPIAPSGSSNVSAASGPYAAELSASSPKIGMPAAAPMHSARASSDASGFPNKKSSIGMPEFSYISPSRPTGFSPALSLTAHRLAGRTVALNNGYLQLISLCKLRCSPFVPEGFKPKC